jgi:hypothetical protein
MDAPHAGRGDGMSGGVGGFLGQTAFTVAGHKLPYGAIAAIAGVAGVGIVLYARAHGAPVASVGTTGSGTYTDAFGNTYDANGNLVSGAGGSTFGPDYSASLSNLSQQISDLQGQIQNSSGAPGSNGTPNVTPTPPSRPPISPAPLNERPGGFIGPPAGLPPGSGPFQFANSATINPRSTSQL